MSTNNGYEWVAAHLRVHYEDCWREHHDCAIKEIERLQEEILYLRNKYGDALYIEREYDRS